MAVFGSMNSVYLSTSLLNNLSERQSWRGDVVLGDVTTPARCCKKIHAAWSQLND